MRIKPIRATVEPSIAPTIRAPLGVTSGFARGLGQVGQAVGEAGQVLQEIGLRKKYFDDSVSLTNLTNEAKIALEGHSQLIQSTDYPDVSDARKKDLERIGQDMGGKASDINPEVAASWKNAWNTLSADSQIRTGRIETEKFRQNTIAGVVNYLHIMEDEAVKATIEGDTEKLSIINQSVGDAVDNVRDNFRVPGHMAETWKEQFQNTIAAQVKAAAKESQKQQEKQVVTAAYLGIKEEARDPLTGKTDYTKAYNLLSNPETLKQYGLMAEQKKTLTGILTNEQAREKEATDQIKEQDRTALLPRISNGTATDEEIDATTLDAKEKFDWKARSRARSKAINDGKKDPFKEYDPGKRAEISRLLRTNLRGLEELGGEDYIYGLVGKGTQGGLTTEQAEKYADDYRKRNEPEDATDPLKQETYKQAAGSLDLFRKNWHFIEAEVGDDIDDAEASENEYTYGKLVEELEARVKKGEEPYTVLEDIMKPFAAKESGSIIDWFLSWVSGNVQGGRLLSEAERVGAVPKATEGGSPDKDKRARAVDLLMKNKKVVSEETIAAVMEQF